MGGRSCSSKTSTTEFVVAGFEEYLRRERLAKNHTAHVDLFHRLSNPHDRHVIEWRRWVARPWSWKNHIAHGLNRFYQWLESEG